MSDRDQIIEVMARAGASFEEVEYDNFPELFIEQAEHMLAALDKSGLAVVPVEDVRRMREAARRMLEPIEPDGSYAVDGFFKDAALVARALLASKETER
jgi:hypothetical protein